MRICFVRHGRTRVIDGDYFGSGLRPEGADEVRRFAQSGLLSQPDLLLTSPFRRAVETASILGEAFSVTPRIAAGFAEWNLQSQNELAEAYMAEERAGWDDFDRVVAGGESLRTLAGC